MKKVLLFKETKLILYWFSVWKFLEIILDMITINKQKQLILLVIIIIISLYIKDYT